MSNQYLTNDVTELKLNKNITDLLHDNDIFTIEDLWLKKRINLKELGLTDKQIKEICIKLELIGLDLNRKKNRV